MSDEKPTNQAPAPEAGGKPTQEPTDSPRKKPLLVDITKQVLGRAVVISGSKSSKTR